MCTHYLLNSFYSWYMSIYSIGTAYISKYLERLNPLNATPN